MLAYRISSRGLCVIAFLFGIGSLAGCSSSAESALEQGSIAQTLYENGDYGGAKRAIVDAIAQHDDIVQLHLLHGRIAIAMNLQEEAFLAYSDALSLEATNGEALLAVAQLGLQQGYFDEAESAANSIISMSPGQSDALLIKGLLALLRNKKQSAVDFADQILSAKPNDEGAVILKARALAVMGKVEPALELVKAAVSQTGPTQAMTMMEIELFREKSVLPQLLDAFRRLEQFAPKNGDFALDFANTLYKSGDKDSARRKLLNLVYDHPTEQKMLNQVTDIWEEHDSEPLTAIEFTGLAQKGSVEARTIIARFYMRQQEPRLAAMLLKDIATDYWIEAQALYARAIAQLGEVATARLIADRILKRDTANADALFIRASDHLRDKNYVLALNDAQIIVRDNPKLADGHILLAQIYLAKNDPRNARRIYDDAVKLLPQNDQLIESYISFLDSQGDRSRTVSVAQYHARISPASSKAWLRYKDVCSKSISAACLAEANYGLERSRTIYSLDVPPGTPPTRGLFGRLR